jgi:hypothetical protein
VKRTIRHQLETTIETKVAEDAKHKLGVLSFKLGLRYDAGWPDRVFLIPGGRPFFVEFKRSGDDARPLQEFRHELLRKLRYDVELHDDYDAAMNAIKKRLR